MRLRNVLWLVPVLMAAACGGAAPPTASPAPTPAITPIPTPSDVPCCTPPPATSSPTPSATPEPTSALTPIPAELQGTWQATAADGKVTLKLEATAYTVMRTGERGQGSVYANGDLLQFSNGTLCNLIGTYTWAITDGTLTFDEKTEACPGRLPSLAGLAYTKLE